MPLSANEITSFVDISTNVNAEDIEQLIPIIQETLDSMAGVINTRSSGEFYLYDIDSGQLFYPRDPQIDDRQKNESRTVYRKVIDTGELTPSTTKNVAHDINTSEEFEINSTPTKTFTAVSIYGAATGIENDEIFAIPIPDSNTINVRMNNQNVIITTQAFTGSINSSHVVIEYTVL